MPTSLRRPWYFRLQSATGWGALRLGGSVFLIGLVLCSLGNWTVASLPDFESLSTFAGLAILVGGSAWWLRRTRDDLHTIEAFATEPSRVAAVRDHLEWHPRIGLWLAMSVGALVLIGLVLYSVLTFGPRDDGSRLNLVVGLFTSAASASFFYVVMRVAIQYRELGSDAIRVTLFDMRPLLPFSSLGLRFILLVSLVVAADSVVKVLIGDSPMAAITALVYVPLLLGSGLAVVALPAWSIHERIRDEKQRELDRVADALRGDASALKQSAIGAHAESVGAIDLLDYKRHVEAVREWPFDLGVLWRVLLYSAIPVGGWIAGAFVERAIERLLP